MTYTILCPILWIGATVLDCLALSTRDNIWIMISIAIFFLGYVIFIGLFGAVMVQINIYNTEVLDRECSVVKKHLRESGYTFMGYCLGSFFYISFLIFFNIVSMYKQNS